MGRGPETKVLFGVAFLQTAQTVVNNYTVAMQCKNTVGKVGDTCYTPYISSEHAALFGFSNLCPFSRRLGRETGSTPG